MKKHGHLISCLTLSKLVKLCLQRKYLTNQREMGVTGRESLYHLSVLFMMLQTSNRQMGINKFKCFCLFWEDRSFNNHKLLGSYSANHHPFLLSLSALMSRLTGALVSGIRQESSCRWPARILQNHSPIIISPSNFRMGLIFSLLAALCSSIFCVMCNFTRLSPHRIYYHLISHGFLYL